MAVLSRSSESTGSPSSMGRRRPSICPQEGLLLSVLLGGIRQRRVVGDAEALPRPSPVSARPSMAAPLSVSRARAAGPRLWKSLREAVDEGLGGLVEIPLQVAAEPGGGRRGRRAAGVLPLAAGGEHGARALVEVEVPEAMDVGDLVGAGLASRERLVALALGVAPIAGPDEALPAHEAAHGGVAGYQAEGGVLAREGDEVVVVQLPGPSRMIAVLAGDGLGERGTDARMGAGVCVHLAREGGEGSCAPRAMYHQRSIVLNEKRMDSPVVGCRQAGRRAPRCGP